MQCVLVRGLETKLHEPQRIFPFLPYPGQPFLHFYCCAFFPLCLYSPSFSLLSPSPSPEFSWEHSFHSDFHSSQKACVRSSPAALPGSPAGLHYIPNRFVCHGGSACVILKQCLRCAVRDCQVLSASLFQAWSTNSGGAWESGVIMRFSWES